MGLFSSVGQAYRFLLAVYGGTAAWAVRAALQFLAQLFGARRWQRVLGDVLFLPAAFFLAVAVCYFGVGRPEHFTLPGMLCGYVIAQTALGGYMQALGRTSKRILRKIGASRILQRLTR